MSVSDFLFNGSPPPATTTYGTSTASMPQWYSDYTQGVLAKGNAVASEPFQAYNGPRLAGFNSDQNAAFDSVRNAQGMGQGAIQGGINNINSSLQNSNPYNAAMPWLNASGQSAANTVGNYMNPYNDAVTDRIATMGARNLQEKLMPAIGDDFVRAGQYGSMGNQQAVGRALRDTQESVLAKQSDVLQQGYGQAMGYAQGDLQRYGNLGQVAGNMAGTQQSNSIDGAAKMGALSQIGQDMRYKDIDAMSNIGATQQNFAQKNVDTRYNDFVEQRDYPKNQLGFMSNLVRGMQMPTSTSTSDTGPAASYAPSGLAGGLSAGLGTYALLNN